jgi:hypothetical protein
VTSDNYLDIAKAFLSTYGGAVVAIKDGKMTAYEYSASPKQWGAWRAYFKARKLSVAFMDERGRDGKCITVPALWPHEFDADASVQDDYRAGEWFVSAMERHTARRRMLDVDARKIQVQRLLKPYQTEKQV